MKLTPDEYAAIGRRVAEDKTTPQIGLSEAEADRAALLELCERMMEKWQKRFPTIDRTALMESLGGADG